MEIITITEDNIKDPIKLIAEIRKAIINNEMENMILECNKVICPYCHKEKIFTNKLNRKNRKVSFIAGENNLLHCVKCKRDFGFWYSELCYNKGYDQGYESQGLRG